MRNMSTSAPYNWQELDDNYRASVSTYDGVNTQAISSILFPELEKCRIPTNVSVRCGLVNKSFSFNLITNASGNCGFYMRPDYIDRTEWLRVYNDVSFEPISWAQGPLPSTTTGPLDALTTVR